MCRVAPCVLGGFGGWDDKTPGQSPSSASARASTWRNRSCEAFLMENRLCQPAQTGQDPSLAVNWLFLTFQHERYRSEVCKERSGLSSLGCPENFFLRFEHFPWGEETQGCEVVLHSCSGRPVRVVSGRPFWVSRWLELWSTASTCRLCLRGQAWLGPRNPQGVGAMHLIKAANSGWIQHGFSSSAG